MRASQRGVGRRQGGQPRVGLGRQFHELGCIGGPWTASERGFKQRRGVFSEVPCGAMWRCGLGRALGTGGPAGNVWCGLACPIPAPGKALPLTQGAGSTQACPVLLWCVSLTASESSCPLRLPVTDLCLVHLSQAWERVRARRSTGDVDGRFLHASWAFLRVLWQCGNLRSLGFGIETRAAREGPGKILTWNVGLERLGSGPTRFVNMDV